MSKQKKARKERRPNIAATTINVSMASGQGGAELPRPSAVAAERKAAGAVFDYSYVKKDLTRIGILASSFIVAFVALSFILNR